MGLGGASPEPGDLAASAVRAAGGYGQGRISFRLMARAQEVAMTSKQDFTDEEWTRIRRAPLVAGVAISLADPGGPIEMAKETMATLRSATLPPSQEELLASVALDVQALAQHKQNPLGDFKPRGGQQVLEELREVNEIVTAKATPEEVEAFRRWLVAAAQAAADAGKEGGFMGFGAERVSAGERQMLEQVRAAVGMA
jgi:hypothetical protein